MSLNQGEIFMNLNQGEIFMNLNQKDYVEEIVKVVQEHEDFNEILEIL